MWSQVTDSRGIASRQYVDSLGRTTKTIEAYDGVNTTITATANKTTEYLFDFAGRLKTVQATLPSGKKQQTGYVYGASFATGSFINSNDIMVATQYAASSTNPALDGLASADEQVTQTVDATGQVLTTLDRNGTKHVFKYDVLGRVIADTVAMRGTAIDNSVRRMEVAYDAQGNAATMSTYSDVKGGSIVNQVQRAFNGLGQLTTEYQSHSGAVVTTSTPKVGYTYADPTLGNNGARQTGMVYPNGRALTYNYDSGVDNNISRLSSISDTSGTLESYQYMGLSTVVVRDHPLNGVSLTYVKKSTESMGDAGDNYTGLDRFGRVVDQRWVKNVGGTVTDIERFQYTYDRASNVLSKVNAIDSTKTENYAYDNLNQLTTFTRGGTTRTQNFTADGMGNFSTVVNVSNGVSTTQTRTHNAQNELATISGTAATPTYDANGNLTKDETGALLTYDGWNRLVKVVKGSATVTYSYDALGRRITESVNGATKDLYYSKDWQVLEERVGGSAKIQYVWSPVYVDAMIERDRDASSTVAGLEERIWSLHDANFNTTALVTSVGAVTEHFLYDPYGRLTDASGSAATPSTTNDWIYLHQGGRLDANTALYNFRNRDYSPTLMRWTTNDPLGFGGGDTNTYRYVGNGPTGGLDPSGLMEGMGHHYASAGVVTDEEFKRHLSKRAIRRAAGYVSGPTWPPHLYGTYGGVKHSDYNIMVKEELRAYLKKNGFAKEGKNGNLVNIKKMRETDMDQFINNLRSGKSLSNPTNAEAIKKFNDAVDKEAKDFIKKFGAGTYSNIDEAGKKKLGKRLLRNSRQWILPGVFSIIASGFSSSQTLANGFESLSEEDSPFRQALTAANNGDFVNFERAVFGDENNPIDPTHIFGYLAQRTGLDATNEKVITAWKVYCTTMRAAIERAKDACNFIDGLDDNEDDDGESINYTAFFDGFNHVYKGSIQGNHSEWSSETISYAGMLLGAIAKASNEMSNN